MWNRLRFIRFLQVSQIFQRRKSDANKQDFENKFNLTCHAQSPPKTTGILTKVFNTCGPNLVALAWTGDELSRGQAQNGVNFDFEVKFDLEGQGQSPPKTIGILTKVFYIYSSNLVILADTGHELSRGQARDWRTDGHTHRQTDAGNDNTRRPILASGKNGHTTNFGAVLHNPDTSANRSFQVSHSKCIGTVALAKYSNVAPKSAFWWRTDGTNWKPAPL